MLYKLLNIQIRPQLSPIGWFKAAMGL